MSRQVMLQCLFAKRNGYWIVQREVPGAIGAQSTPATRFCTPSSSTSYRISQSSHNVAQSLTARFSSAIEEDKARYCQLDEPNHISEITPWLRKSAMHTHLASQFAGNNTDWVSVALNVRIYRSRSW